MDIIKITAFFLIFMAGCTYNKIMPGMSEIDKQMYEEGWELVCEEHGCHYIKETL